MELNAMSDTLCHNLNYQITNLCAVPEGIKGSCGDREEGQPRALGAEAGRWSC